MATVIEGVDKAAITQVMLGTTHPANAIIQRKSLDRVGILRLAAPSSYSVRPGAAWPDDLRAMVVGPTAIVHGGFEYDGREIAPLDEDEIRAFAAECRGIGLGDRRLVRVQPGQLRPRVPRRGDPARGARATRSRSRSATRSPRSASSSARTRRPSTRRCSGVSRAVVDGLQGAMAQHGLAAAVYLTQNDGTLMTVEQAVKFPILTVGSGPTNSMRGACALAGITDALVMDVGGTSTDVGILIDGFPRESAAAIEVGGVRTNFRMPDLISIGLGGGTIVRGAGDDVAVGPDSVGYRVVTEALIMGGSTLTLSDVSTRAGRLEGMGDGALAASASTRRRSMPRCAGSTSRSRRCATG